MKTWETMLISASSESKLNNEKHFLLSKRVLLPAWFFLKYYLKNLINWPARVNFEPSARTFHLRDAETYDIYLRETEDWDRKRLPHFNTEKKVALFDRSKSSSVIDVRMDSSILKEK